MRIPAGLAGLMFVLFSALACVEACCAENNGYYYVLNTRNGLSDNRILQMLQLPDGRMAIRTEHGVDVYDGRRCRFVALDKAESEPLSAYTGHVHMYADGDKRLWIKARHTVHCIDLTTLRTVHKPLFRLSQAAGQPFDDLFVDSNRRLWVVSLPDTASASRGNGGGNSGLQGNSAVTMNRVDDGFQVKCKAEWGALQDMDAADGKVYTFHSKGIVAVFDGTTGRFQYSLAAYGKEDAPHYGKTSLAVKTPRGTFYQLRTDNRQSVLLRFDPAKRTYSRVFSCPYILHTLNVTTDNQALVSSQRGYLMFDFRHGDKPKEVNRLSLPDGTSLVTGINTVCRDTDGGIWLGTYSNGVIYVSPYLGLFFTAQEPWWQRGWVWLAVATVVFSGVLAVFFAFRTRRMQPKDEVFADEQTPPHGEELPALLAQCTRLVEEHMAQCDYGVEQLAADLCMERTGLYKKITAITADTPVTFIRNVRLRRASELLREGRLSVNEVAALTGFASPSYFTKCFKAKYGVKPSEFR